jgi:hypothetical protein
MATKVQAEAEAEERARPKPPPSPYYAPNQQTVRADGSGPAEEGSGCGTAPPVVNPIESEDET